MTDLRQAAQQALEALERADKDDFWREQRDAITALRTALEQQQAEPVTCGYDETTGNCTRNPCCHPTPPQRQWDRPSASFNEWWNGDYDDSANPFEQDSAAYWAWAGWKGAKHD